MNRVVNSAFTKNTIFAKGATTGLNESQVNIYDRVFAKLLSYWAVDTIQITESWVQGKLNEELTQPFVFLDLGCGTGLLAFHFIERHLIDQSPSNFRLIATDSSEAMLQGMKQRLDNDRYEGIASSINCVAMDGQKLDQVDGNSIDMIGSNFAMAFFPQRKQALEHADRVLKKGGILVSTIWDESSGNNQLNNAVSQLANDRLSDGDKIPLVELDFRSSIIEMKEAGFKDVAVFSTTHSHVLTDKAEIIDATLAQPMSNRWKQVLSEEEIRTAMSEFLDRESHIENSKSTQWSPCVIHLKGHIIVARKA